MDTKHTPTPWGYWTGSGAYGQHGAITDNALGRHIAYMAGGAPLPELDGAFIVRACNAHDQLVAALQLVIQDKAPAYHDCLDDGESECAWCIARAAIAAVTNKS